MLELLFSVFVAAVVLILVESRTAKRHLPPEVSRKLVHIVHGVAAATWPFFVSYKAIIITELLFIVAVSIARKFRLFHDLRSVHRLTWGEFFYPMGIIGVALIQPNEWVFAAAMLHLAFADSIAALVGKKFGKKHTYKVFGSTKSVEGTVAFWVVSFVITSWVVFIAPAGIIEGWYIVIMLPIIASAVENFGIYGFDNFLVPIVVATLLSVASS